MRIRKQYQVIPTNAKLENGDSTSATNGYTADYINDHSVVVSAVEPSGSARKKVWKQHSNNLAPINNFEDASKECKVQIFNLIEGETLNLNYKKTRIAGVTITNNQLWAYKNADTYFVLKDNTTVSLGTPELVALTSGSHTFSKTLTIPSNVAYLQINFNNNNGDTNPNTKVEDIMLSYGSIALPYEPYVEDKEYILNNNVYEEYNDKDKIIEDTQGSLNNSTYASAGGAIFYKNNKVVHAFITFTLVAYSSPAGYIKIGEGLKYKPTHELFINTNVLTSNDVLSSNFALIQIKPNNGDIYLKTTQAYGSGQKIYLSVTYITND